MKTFLKGLGPDQKKALADGLDTSPAYLSQIASGYRKASHELARRIEIATDGKVTREELRPDIFNAA